MTSGGLLRDPSRLWSDRSFQQATVVQLGVIAIVLALSAFYHFFLRRARSESEDCYDDDVAEIDALVVYPLKSGRGILLKDAQVTRKGFQYDRRWALIKVEGLQKLNLKVEARITHIVPSFDEANGMLRLRVGEACDKRLPDIGIPLNADAKTRESWPLVDKIEMYGDTAEGRQVPLAAGEKWEWPKTPSDWASEIIGYPVYFLQFEPVTSARNSFPLPKAPHDLKSWTSPRSAELQSSTNLEFQDLYPFLVTTRESLAHVETQLEAAIANDAIKHDADYWKKHENGGAGSLSMLRFRPNIVLRARAGAKAYPPYSEDSWETIWIEDRESSNEKKEQNDGNSGMPIHLVARCDRCLLTSVDPETAHRDVNVPLSLLRKSRSRIQAHMTKKPMAKPCFGMYSIPEQVQGAYTTIHVGDKVRVRWRPYADDDEMQYGRRRLRDK